jgi:hypothetical protein
LDFVAVVRVFFLGVAERPLAIAASLLLKEPLSWLELLLAAFLPLVH